ncbi:MAG: molybdopterin molybdotransferase MoeA [Nitrospirae bacterium]|nr:molybdopterin molybdotransferase MoeA [Nitrospirota bacterium]
MIKVEEALDIVLESVKSMDAEKAGIIDSFGRVLAEDIKSDYNIPAFDYSAMDGYAVRVADTKGASAGKGAKLKVAGELRAGGDTSARVEKGQAVKIMTGAPIPQGANAVVMVEDTKMEDGNVAVLEEAEKGENIRLAGEDIKKGDLVISKGTLLREGHIGILAALGIPEVNVTRRPKVAILATGDEVISIDEDIKPGKVRNSNAYSLHAQVLACGGIPINKGVARDDIEGLKAKLRSCLDCDIIITSGGVSMGEYDYVKDVMIDMGMKLKFWKVAMRPGKPNLFGIINSKPFFGLPGNPVSTMVGFEVFVKPAILKMLGRINDDRREVEAVLEEDIRKKKGLKFFIRAQTRWEDGCYITRTTGPQGSGILSSMVKADSFIILPEDEELVKQGEKVLVRLL